MVPAVPAPASTVLVAAPTYHDGDAETCRELLGGEAEADILWVTYGAGQIERVRGAVDGTGEGVEGVVLAAGERRLDATDFPAGVSVESLDPADLTGLGIAVNRYLGDCTALCFDSLTALLQYVDLERAYEFLQVLGGQAAAAGTRTHFHLDPDAHDDRTVATLTSLCDATVRLEGGELTVRSRYEGYL